jgi:hypothetical protein
MKAGEIARQLGIPIQRAYQLARRMRWPERSTWPQTTHVYEWDCEITPELRRYVRRTSSGGKVKMPGRAAEFCRHGFPVPSWSGKSCPRCIAVSESVVVIALEETAIEIPAGVPGWVYK